MELLHQNHKEPLLEYGNPYLNANCVYKEYRYKFVDDLMFLEKVNLLLIGLKSFLVKLSVPFDILIYNQYIPNINLNFQKHIKNI